MAGANSLGSAREMLLIAYSEDLIDDIEFVLLYDLNLSRELYPYWKFDRFNLTSWDDSQYRTDLRFRKTDLALLIDVFNCLIQ